MVHPAKKYAVPPALRLRLVLVTLVLLVLVGLAASWSWSPLRQWLDVGTVVAELKRSGQAFGPVLATLCFALALVVAVPLTFLTLVTLVAFGPVQGFFIAILAAALGACVTFLMGKALGHDLVLRIGGPRVNLVSERLSKRGILAVVAIRMVPVAPFAIVNMIAGATHLSLRDMVIGTVVGMTPGTLLMMFLLDWIVDAMKQPGVGMYVMAALLVVLIGGGIFGLKKWLSTEHN
jgi:uncharacterized membrane protein YdjX (TVP38/TMEM64 family)